HERHAEPAGHRIDAGEVAVPVRAAERPEVERVDGDAGRHERQTTRRCALSGARSAGRRRRPRGSRSAVASDTEHHRKTNWLSARLARAFQMACRMAAQTTRTTAGPLTDRSYRTSGMDIGQNPSIDRGLGIN